VARDKLCDRFSKKMRVLTRTDALGDQFHAPKSGYPPSDVTLRYKITPIDSIRYQLAVVKGSPDYLKQRASYYYGRALWLLLWGYALVISIIYVQSVAAVLVLAGLFIFQLRQFLPFDSHLQRLFLERYGSAAVKELHLRMDGGGLTESEGDVIFFSPWASIQHAGIHEDLLLIKVHSGHYIVVPRHALEPKDISLEAINNEIAARLQKSQKAGEAALQ
jgi:hypothetical protein